MRDCVRRFAEAIEAAAPVDHTNLTEEELLDIIEHHLEGGEGDACKSLVEIGVAAMAAWDNRLLRSN